MTILRYEKKTKYMLSQRSRLYVLLVGTSLVVVYLYIDTWDRTGWDRTGWDRKGQSGTWSDSMGLD